MQIIRLVGNEATKFKFNNHLIYNYYWYYGKCIPTTFYLG